MRRRHHRVRPWGVVSLALLLVGTAGCACVGRAKDVVPAEPLPRMFRDVTWTTSPAELRRLLSVADVHETEWECADGSRCVSIMATADGWPAFGHAMITLSGPVGRSARLVTLTAVDPREGCRPEAEASSRPRDCVDHPGPAMEAAFERMRKALEAELGRGQREPLDPQEGQSVGTTAERAANERSLRWKRGGYEVALHVFAGDYEWNLEVQAFRGW